MNIIRIENNLYSRKSHYSSYQDAEHRFFCLIFCRNYDILYPSPIFDWYTIQSFGLNMIKKVS